MATTDNNLRVPDDLLDEARRLADEEGCTPDELAADALRRYIDNRRSVRELHDLASWGQRYARERGFNPSDVEAAISDLRHGRS